MELPIPHIWADEQVSGTAEFVDDMPQYKDELCLVLVTSTRSAGKISSITYDEALKVPGVVGHISANDYPRYYSWKCLNVCSILETILDIKRIDEVFICDHIFVILLKIMF